MGRPRKYFTEEERKQAHRESQNRYYDNNKNNDEFKLKQRENAKRFAQEHPEIVKENQKHWRDEHPDYEKEYRSNYRLTPKGRAVELFKHYKQEDKKHNRGECTITSDWIVENIFTQPCHYCGETDWYKLGCDRIDNSLSHTPDNVVPCCWDCNRKRKLTPYDKFITKIKSGGSPTS